MKSLVQNGPKTMFFKDYSLLVVFDAYLRSKCTNPNIYTCDGAGLVVIRSLMTALCLSKKKKKMMNNSRGRRFQFTTLETSASFAKGIFLLRTIV